LRPVKLYNCRWKKEGAESMDSILLLLPLLLYIGFFLLGIFAVIYFLKLTKERNDVLKEIRDEMNKRQL
jgi:hypothetical protein